MSLHPDVNTPDSQTIRLEKHNANSNFFNGVLDSLTNAVPTGKMIPLNAVKALLRILKSVSDNSAMMFYETAGTNAAMTRVERAKYVLGNLLVSALLAYGSLKVYRYQKWSGIVTGPIMISNLSMLLGSFVALLEEEVDFDIALLPSGNADEL